MCSLEWLKIGFSKLNFIYSFLNIKIYLQSSFISERKKKINPHEFEVLHVYCVNFKEELSSLNDVPKQYAESQLSRGFSL